MGCPEPPKLQGMDCKHLADDLLPIDRGEGIETDYVAYCAAFPDGMPEDDEWEDFDHRRPYPGDHGIRFEPKT